jgi:hypothetical protein
MQALVYFDGADYNHERDQKRLMKQSDRVFEFMKSGAWRTLRQISDATGAPEASASAALRDFRKERFGSHTVNRRYVENGLYEYSLEVNQSKEKK